MNFALAQNLLVAPIVCACTAYALWSLMPAAARRLLATQALRLPLPSMLAALLRRAAKPAHGCGCDGCDHAPPKPSTSATRRVTVHPRARR